MTRLLVATLLFPTLVLAQTEPPPPPLPKQQERSGKTSGIRQQVTDDPAVPLDPNRLKKATASSGRAMSRAWYMTGRYRIAKGDFKGGLEAFKKAVGHDEKQVAIYREMLQVALRLNRVDEAVGYAQKAVSLNPDDYQLLRWLSRQMISRQKLPEAIKLLEQARKSKTIDHKSTVFVNVMRDLGLIYMASGKSEASADCFAVVFAALQDPAGYKLDDRMRRALLANPATSYERMGEVFLAAKRTKLAVEAFQAAASGGKGNPATLGFNLARVHVETGELDKALEHLQVYFDKKQSSKGRAAYVLLARILKEQKKTASLLEHLEKLSAHDPDNASLTIYLADQHAAAKADDKALAFYERGLAKATPADREAAYWGLSSLHRRGSRGKELLETLGEALGARGDIKRLDGELKQIAGDEKLSKDLLKQASLQAEDDQVQAPFARRLVAARFAIQMEQNDTAATLLTWTLAVEKSTRENKDRLMLDQLRRHVEDLSRALMVAEKYDPASSLLRAACDDRALGVFKPQFLFQLSQAYEFGEKTEQALAAIAEARRTSNHPLLHYQEAWIHYHAHQWDKAVPMFERVIQQFPEDKSVVRRCQFSLSNIYVQQGDIRKGEKVLEDVFAEDPDNPSVNNDLGYLYADQGKKLEQAEQMIRKALKAEPKNSAYLDSMGWVLFKRGKFAESLEYLEKASSDRDGEDPTILEHLGDCQQKLNKKQEAVKNWKTALKLARDEKRPDKKLIQRLEQKLKDAGEEVKSPKPKP
tara:strand:+ start:35 stop:2311 length:2277 start_codon:yes stop_codon:yes gene_type:complete